MRSAPLSVAAVLLGRPPSAAAGQGGRPAPAGPLAARLPPIISVLGAQPWWGGGREMGGAGVGRPLCKWNRCPRTKGSPSRARSLAFRERGPSPHTASISSSGCGAPLGRGQSSSSPTSRWVGTCTLPVDFTHRLLFGPPASASAPFPALRGVQSASPPPLPQQKAEPNHPWTAPRGPGPTCWVIWNRCNGRRGRGSGSCRCCGDGTCDLGTLCAAWERNQPVPKFCLNSPRGPHPL